MTCSGCLHALIVVGISTHLQNHRVLLVIELQTVRGADPQLDKCTLASASLLVAQIHLEALQASALLAALGATDEVTHPRHHLLLRPPPQPYFALLPQIVQNINRVRSTRGWESLCGSLCRTNSMCIIAHTVLNP